MYKKILATFAVLSVSFFGVFASYDNEEMIDAANDLAQREVIKDKSSNPSEYNLSDNVLRQEIGLIAMRVAGLQKKSSCGGIFKDISSTSPNDWACVHIETLVENNLISKNEFFRPEDNITKAESLKMLIKAIGYDFEYDASSSVSWQQQYVDFAVSKDIIENFSDHNALASRGWVFVVAAHTIEVKEKEEAQENQEECDDDDYVCKCKLNPTDDCKYSDEVLQDVEELLNMF